MDSSLPQIESWLQQEVAPVADQIDQDTAKLKSTLQQMGDRSWLGLKAPRELGGMGLEEVEYHRLQISFARTSGALTFLQTQHQSAVSKLVQSSNRTLQQKFFPDVAQGNALVGVGFSHLRRRGTPMMRAIETKDGYLLTGKVPWITGYGYFDWFILGATLGDGRELYAILPLQNRVQESGGKISYSEPMKLLAVAATNTVSAEINRWYVSPDYLVSINPPATIHHSSQKNILNHGFFALGCAYGGLDVLQDLAESKKLDFLNTSWHVLHQEVMEKERMAIAFICDQQITYAQKLKLRAETIDLAQRCSLAAVIASSGAANYFHSRAGRIYREALLFSVSGQTTDVMKASLKKLLLN